MPAVEHGLGISGQRSIEQGQQRHRPRHAAGVIYLRPGVDQRRQRASELLGLGPLDQLEGHRGEGDAVLDQAHRSDPGRGVNGQKGGAGGGKLLGCGPHPDDVHALGGAAFGQTNQPTAFHRSVVLDHQHHGRHDGSVTGAPSRTLAYVDEFLQLRHQGHRRRAGIGQCAFDGAVGGFGVGKPPQPSPIRRSSGGGEGAQHHLRGAVGAGQLHDQPGGGGQGVLPGAGHTNRPAGNQVQHHRHAVDLRPTAKAFPQLSAELGHAAAGVGHVDDRSGGETPQAEAGREETMPVGTAGPQQRVEAGGGGGDLPGGGMLAATGGYLLGLVCFQRGF